MKNFNFEKQLEREKMWALYQRQWSKLDRKLWRSPTTETLHKFHAIGQKVIEYGLPENKSNVLDMSACIGVKERMLHVISWFENSFKKDCSSLRKFWKELDLHVELD